MQDINYVMNGPLPEIINNLRLELAKVFTKYEVCLRVFVDLFNVLHILDW